jgi:NitT/TauT family transport system substrate-binding protein
MVVRADYAKAHPDMVAKFLAVYEHAVKWELAHPDDAQAALIAADKEGGAEISPAFAKQEFTKRPIYDLAAQLKTMNRAGGASDADKWFAGIVDFMKSKGSIQDSPDPKTFITDAYMQMVDKDPKLKAFANSAN